MLTHLANLANRAHCALVLAVVLGPVKCTFLVRRATVDRGVASCTDLEFGELVELDFYCVMWVTLAQSLGLSCL